MIWPILGAMYGGFAAYLLGYATCSIDTDPVLVEQQGVSGRWALVLMAVVMCATWPVTLMLGVTLRNLRRKHD